MASFGEILCELRKDRHLTQKQLAEKMNVAVGTVSNYETGRHDPDLRALVWLADYFQVTTDYFLGRTNSDISVSYLEEPFTSELTVGDVMKQLSSLSPKSRRLIAELLRSIRLGDMIQAQTAQQEPKKGEP